MDTVIEFFKTVTRSKTLMQFIVVGAVFAIVLGGTYPIMQDANREHENNKYDDKLILEEGLARKRFAAASAHEDKVEEFLAAGDELADVLVREYRYDEATAIYNKQLAITWKMAPNSYNPRYIEINRKVANILRDQSSMDGALICYKTCLDLDQKYLPAGDLKIARDLNNIGITHYLKGLNQTTDQTRKPEFQLAVDNLKKALDIFSQHPENKGQKATALWNLYLAERDLGDKAAAQQFRQQAQAIDKTMHRLCVAP